MRINYQLSKIRRLLLSPLPTMHREHYLLKRNVRRQKQASEYLKRRVNEICTVARRSEITKLTITSQELCDAKKYPLIEQVKKHPLNYRNFLLLMS